MTTGAEHSSTGDRLRAELLRRLAGRTTEQRRPEIPRADRERPLRLSPGQQQMWFLQRLEPDSHEYIVPLTLRLCGAVPEKGAHIRVTRYRTGGGPAGNVARGAISVLRSSVPYIARVVNREAARGGVDGETVENAKLRAPDALRMQERAVTAEDHEIIARQAAPSVRRVRCLPAGDGAGAVRVLVVPDAVADDGDRLRFEQLIPSDQVLAAITGSLDERRLIGTRLVVEPPVYQGVTVVARLATAPGDTDRVRDAALAALFRYLNPLRGGPDGTGWPFGRPVQYGEVFGVLQRATGNALVEEIRLFAADPITGRRGAPVDRIDVGPGALVFSYQHQVVVQPLEPEARP